MTKPELIVQDFGGVNNKDLCRTSARLLKGNSWKRQGIVVILPAASLVPAKCVLSWMNLAYPPNNGVVRILAQGMEVGDAYSSAIEQVLAHQELSAYPYVLTLEQDNSPPPDGVIRLLQDMEEHPEFACIGGLYYTKGQSYIGTPNGPQSPDQFEPCGVAQLWGDVNDPITNFRPQVPVPNTIQEVCGTGMGFNIFRMSMFKDKRIPRPLFKTKTGLNGDGIGTQDLVFWTEARKLGYRCAIDTRIAVGHYDHINDIMY